MSTPPDELPAPADDAVDRGLLGAHVSGDPEAFGELVRRHRERMWAVALRTMRDPDDAADALQDALLSAYRAAGSYRGEARISTWLHRIVVNACLDRMRRERVRPTVPLPDGTGAEPADPVDALGAREVALDLEAALGELPVEQRLAVLLVDVHGLPVDEAADILAVPAGTVKSRCFRARARLAVQLGHLRNPDPVAPVTPLRGPLAGGGDT